MPIPLIIWAIVEITLVAVTIYEATSALRELYNSIDSYSKNLEAAKKEVEKQIEALKKEIDKNISEKEEVAILKQAAQREKRSPETIKAKGRLAGNEVIDVAIQQKIPFRKVISMVCDQAEKMPMIQLRLKKGFVSKMSG